MGHQIPPQQVSPPISISLISSLPSFVRQATLCALNMTVVATPTNYLLSEMNEALEEMILWVKGMHDHIWSLVILSFLRRQRR